MRRKPLPSCAAIPGCSIVGLSSPRNDMSWEIFHSSGATSPRRHQLRNLKHKPAAFSTN